MYEQVKEVIKGKRFELKDMLRKIDVLWLQGDITNAQKAQLEDMARNDADMDKGYASLEERIAALEAWKKQIEENGGAVPDAGETDADYPAWHKPTGAHDAYYTGARMTYTDGKKYECTAPEGYAVVYGPDVLPGMWQLMEG